MSPTIFIANDGVDELIACMKNVVMVLFLWMEGDSGLRQLRVSERGLSVAHASTYRISLSRLSITNRRNNCAYFKQKYLCFTFLYEFPVCFITFIYIQYWPNKVVWDIINLLVIFQIISWPLYKRKRVPNKLGFQKLFYHWNAALSLRNTTRNNPFLLKRVDHKNFINFNFKLHVL